MTKEQVKELLSTRTGYQKKGLNYLSKKLNTPHHIILEAKKELRENKAIRSDLRDLNQKEIVMSNNEAKPLKTSNIESSELYKKFLEFSEALKNHSTVEVKPVVEVKEPLIKEHKLINNNTNQDAGIHIVLGCAHIPFQNTRFLDGIVSFVEYLGNKVKGFHIIGDFLDLNSLSFYDKGNIPIKGITLGYEYKEGNKWLDKFESVLPQGVDKTFIYGNHCERFNRHINDADTNKYSDTMTSPAEGLKLDQRGFKVFTKWREDFYMLGKLQLLHGEFCTSTPAKTHLQRIKQSCMFAHTHRADVHYDGNKAAFNIGSAANFNSEAFEYAGRLTKMNWVNGFGLVQLDPKNNFHAQIITSYNSKFYYNGKCF